VFGALVVPPSTQYDRDFSHVRQLRRLGKGPEDPAGGWR
jgi:hypothetical protein